MTGQQRRLLGIGAAVAVVALLAVGLASLLGGDDGPKQSDEQSLLRANCPQGRPDSSARPGVTATPVAGRQPLLADLGAYRYQVSMSGKGSPFGEYASLFGASGTATPAGGAAEVRFEAEGVFVRPDRAQVAIKNATGEVVCITTVGRQQWVTLGGLTVGPNAIAAASAAELSLAAAFWDEGFASGPSLQCSGERQSLGGVLTRRCVIDAATFDQIKQFLGGSLSDAEAGIREVTRFQLEMFLTESAPSIPAGLPVRLTADLAGKDTSNRDFALKIDLRLSDINKAGVTVAPPR